MMGQPLAEFRLLRVAQRCGPLQFIREGYLFHEGRVRLAERFSIRRRGQPPDPRHMTRPLRRLARGTLRMHLRLVRVLGERDGDQAGRHRLVQAAADGAGEIGLRLALKRPLPGGD